MPASTFKIEMRRKHSIVKAQMVKFKYAEVKNMDNILTMKLSDLSWMLLMESIDTYKNF